MSDRGNGGREYFLPVSYPSCKFLSHSLPVPFSSRTFLEKPSSQANYCQLYCWYRGALGFTVLGIWPVSVPIFRFLHLKTSEGGFSFGQKSPKINLLCNLFLVERPWQRGKTGCTLVSIHEGLWSQSTQIKSFLDYDVSCTKEGIRRENFGK